jgi:hypothetical protein
MLSLIGSQSLPYLDTGIVPDHLVGLAVVPNADASLYGTVDVAVMHFRKWTRGDGAAIYIWHESWVGDPASLPEHIATANAGGALIVGHNLFADAYPLLERLGADIAPLVGRTVDVGFEIAAKVEQRNPWVSYYSGLGATAAANSAGEVGTSPSRAFEERFADVPEAWRAGMWDATLACWLWTVAVAEGQIALPPFAEERIDFAADDVATLVGARPRFDSTLWGLRQMLDEAA